MPFARNEATEYINPTKRWRYMATAKPIVSDSGAGRGFQLRQRRQDR
jgi:hypothetical protein